MSQIDLKEFQEQLRLQPDLDPNGIGGLIRDGKREELGKLLRITYLNEEGYAYNLLKSLLEQMPSGEADERIVSGNK